MCFNLSAACTTYNLSVLAKHRIDHNGRLHTNGILILPMTARADKMRNLGGDPTGSFSTIELDPLFELFKWSCIAKITGDRDDAVSQRLLARHVGEDGILANRV